MENDVAQLCVTVYVWSGVAGQEGEGECTHTKLRREKIKCIMHEKFDDEVFIEAR
jgi:hypothetical protein